MSCYFYMLYSHSASCLCASLFFFFNDTATTEIYTLSLHDALPISCTSRGPGSRDGCGESPPSRRGSDRKSTRLNSSHQIISYAVFCLKKKKKHNMTTAIKSNNIKPHAATFLNTPGAHRASQTQRTH